MSLRRLARYALFFAPLLILPLAVSASIDANSTGLVEAGRAAGLNSICSSDASACIADLVGRFLNMVLGFIGLILFVYVVYGGALYMSAAGDPKQVQKAKDTLQNAIVGVFLVVLAFAVSSFVLDRAIEVTGGGTQISGGGGGGAESPGAPGSSDAPGAPGEGAGSICNCDCAVGGRAFSVPPGAITGACAVGPSGNCTAACTATCRVSGGVPSSIGATCDSVLHTDTRVPSMRCETTPGIGIAPYGATIRAGGLCAYAQRQCDACMREQLVASCTAAGATWDTTQIAIAQGNASARCGAVCNPGPTDYAIACPP